MRRNARRFTVRIVTSIAAIISGLGMTLVGAGTASAETPDATQQSNFYMYWDSHGSPSTAPWSQYPGSSSNVYAPTDTDPWNWYGCYVEDCDGIVADKSGVHLLSTEKKYANIATDHQILGGYYGYSYTDANGTTLYYSGTWNGKNTLAWTKQIYSPDMGGWITLTLSYANLELYWKGQPQVPTCDPQTVSAVGFCSMK